MDDYINENNTGIGNDADNYRDIKLSYSSAYAEEENTDPISFL
ncbi:MAG TPA: hypothetical protein VGC75_01125 [Candidatus Nitrosocosmicus sp.]